MQPTGPCNIGDHPTPIQPPTWLSKVAAAILPTMLPAIPLSGMAFGVILARRAWRDPTVPRPLRIVQLGLITGVTAMNGALFLEVLRFR
jgi:hypothetical protein